MYKGKTKKFRDTIHGYIDIPDVIVSNIIDTEQFQRLRYIEQTSMRSLYPAARHDRFIHSLGVYWLGQQAFQYFRLNSQNELRESETKTLTDRWWNRQEILFCLACLLHDCAHAPFSHTLENMYILRQKTLTGRQLYGLEENSKICELDYELLEICGSDKEFSEDFLQKDEAMYRGCGAPHEKMSSYCVVKEYKDRIKTICRNMLGEDIGEEDIVFIVRMIIGCTYKNNDTEKSVRNCIISMLNSSSVDVDGLDYIVRDAYMSGIDNFNIDYQRLLSSFTVIPVEVFQEQEVAKKSPFDGIWLKGTRLKIKSLEAEAVLGKMVIEGLSKTDQESVQAIGGNNRAQNGVYSAKADDETRIKDIRSGMLLLEESCRFSSSKFTGTIKQGRRIVSQLHPSKLPEGRREYVLGYDKKSLSVIQSTVEARNHEYLWVYSHPKVLYSSNYLQCELLRNSANYLCCVANNKDFSKQKLTFNCEECEYHKKNKTAEEDFVLYIMGYDAYYRKDPENGMDEDVYRKLADNGFVFEQSCDDDLNALFKRVYLENRKRGELSSEKIENLFREFFTRKHKKALWKSFVEYDNFLKICEEDRETRNVIPRFCESVIFDDNIYHSNYAEPSEETQKVFAEYGMEDVVVIKASVKTKELNPNETFIKFKDQTLRLYDIYDKTSRKEKMSKEFYYIFANMKTELTHDELLSMVKKLDTDN